MGNGNGSNVERLLEAGLITQTPLPGPYNEVIEDLSGDEVDTLINVFGSVKQRLDEAQRRAGEPYSAYFVPF